MRRLLDILVSLLLLTLLAPILAMAALAVKLGSPGPVFYRAERVGAGGRSFRMLKFRTMVRGADEMGPGITVPHDPRVTPTGRFLRATKIDEMPQFFNVLMGDMTLVGPRPEDPRFVLHYTAEQRTILEVRPGVTGPGQLEYTLRHQDDLVGLQQAEEVYVRKILADKLRWDLNYLHSRTFLGDLAILARTGWIVVRRIIRPAAG